MHLPDLWGECCVCDMIRRKCTHHNLSVIVFISFNRHSPGVELGRSISAAPSTSTDNLLLTSTQTLYEAEPLYENRPLAGYNTGYQSDHVTHVPTVHSNKAPKPPTKPPKCQPVQNDAKKVAMKPPTPFKPGKGGGLVECHVDTHEEADTPPEVMLKISDDDMYAHVVGNASCRSSMSHAAKSGHPSRSNNVQVPQKPTQGAAFPSTSELQENELANALSARLQQINAPGESAGASAHPKYHSSDKTIADAVHKFDKPEPVHTGLNAPKPPAKPKAINKPKPPPKKGPATSGASAEGGGFNSLLKKFNK